MKVVALRSRAAGGGFKPPRAALAEDCCGERSRKRHPVRGQGGGGETSASESLLTCRNKDRRHQNRGLAVGSRDEPGGCPCIGQAVSGMEAAGNLPTAPERNGRRRAPTQPPRATGA